MLSTPENLKHFEHQEILSMPSTTRSPAESWDSTPSFSRAQNYGELFAPKSRYLKYQIAD